MSVTAIGSNNISDTYTANTTAKDKTTAASKAEDTQKVTGTTAEASAEKTETKNDNANTAAVYDKSKLSADEKGNRSTAQGRSGKTPDTADRPCAGYAFQADQCFRKSQ